MNPTMNPTNARFWIFHNGGYVKLVLCPGNSLHCHRSGWNGEGMSWEEDTWTHEGDCIRNDWGRGGMDCDGCHRETGTCYCRLDRLASHPRWTGDDDAVPKGLRDPSPPSHIAAWERDESSVRIYDQFAQAAGY